MSVPCDGDASSDVTDVSIPLTGSEPDTWVNVTQPSPVCSSLFDAGSSWSPQVSEGWAYLSQCSQEQTLVAGNVYMPVMQYPTGIAPFPVAMSAPLTCSANHVQPASVKESGLTGSTGNGTTAAIPGERSALRTVAGKRKGKKQRELIKSQLLKESAPGIEQNACVVIQRAWRQTKKDMPKPVEHMSQPTHQEVQVQTSWHGHHIDQMLQQNEEALRWVRYVPSFVASGMAFVMLLLALLYASRSQHQTASQQWGFCKENLLACHDSKVALVIEMEERLMQAGRNLTIRSGEIQRLADALNKAQNDILEGDRRNAALVQQLGEMDDVLKNAYAEKKSISRQLSKSKDDMAKAIEQNVALTQRLNDKDAQLNALTDISIGLEERLHESDKVDQRLSAKVAEETVASDKFRAMIRFLKRVLRLRSDAADTTNKKWRAAKRKNLNTLHHGLHWKWRHDDSKKKAKELFQTVEELTRRLRKEKLVHESKIKELENEVEKARSSPTMDTMKVLVGFISSFVIKHFPGKP